MVPMFFRFVSFSLWAVLACAISPAVGQQELRPDPVASLVRAYPDFLDRIDGNELVWKDGTRMRIDDGEGKKTFEAMLVRPDIKDMFAMTYPIGEEALPPEVNFDPGRIRNTAFFEKIYGDCRTSDLLSEAANVIWLKTKYGKTIKFSKINGAAEALQKVSDEFDELPNTFTKFLAPIQGTYNCRSIAGTDRLSAHGFGIAIDIAGKYSDYWRWAKPDAEGRIVYQNKIPWEIVSVFEKHGFIWGGKWYHYDTMHFEYRPELFPDAK